MAFRKPAVPVIQVGQFAGTPVDQLPLSYLRWMMTQDFPKDIMEAARRKLKNSSYNNSTVHITRHALDMYSERFLQLWLNTAQYEEVETKRFPLGFCSFVAQQAQEAWDKGKDVSKRRHSRDGVIRDYRGIQWVFSINYAYPEYKDVITVMASGENPQKKLDSKV